MIIITGASSNHYKSLLQLIETFEKHLSKETIIIYNLGLDENKASTILNICKKNDYIYKIFDYNKYPSFFNININAGEYAWKPAVIKEVSDEYKDIIFWLDAGCIVKNNLFILKKFIEKNYIYSPMSKGVINDWTHIKTIQYLNVDKKYYNSRNVSGGIIAFDNRIDWIKELINKWQKYSSIKECIAPDGSDRSNHRQDQSILTILLHQYKDKYIFEITKKYLGIKPHCDID